MSPVREHPFRPALIASALLSFSALGSAQVQSGDILLNMYHGSASTLDHFTSDGISIASLGGSGGSWEGVAVTNTGLLATTQRSTTEVLLFDSAGSQVSAFSLSANGFIPGDLDVFDDGTLAVVDQGGDIDLHSEAGVYLTSFTDAQLDHPFGCYIDAQDHLWVCDITTVGSGSGLIFEFDRQGMVQQVITTTNFEPGDLVIDGDGAIWATGRSDGTLHHLDQNGTTIASFTTTVVGNFAGIALHQDGTLLLTGEGDSQIHRYTKQGVELGTFPTTGSGSPLFMIVAGVGSLGTNYCYGDGTALACPCGNPGGQDEACANSTSAGATLRGSGSSSVATDSLQFTAAQLPPNQPALLFSALNAVQGGNGALFGDGLRCAGGSVRRLGVTPANATGDAAWGPSLAPAGGWQGGDIRRFQVWYRDPVGGPCNSGFNLTSGVEIIFTP